MDEKDFTTQEAFLRDQAFFVSQLLEIERSLFRLVVHLRKCESYDFFKRWRKPLQAVLSLVRHLKSGFDNEIPF